MIEPSKVLAGIPTGLRGPLFQHYQEIATNFAEHRWEPAELDGGKLCEVVYTIIDGCIKKRFAAKPSKPANLVQACRALEALPADPTRVGDRSLRVLVPRVLLALYEIRNNRGVGHTGGDVDPNFMDATVVYGMASWTMAELVRIFHGVSTAEAQETVDALVERKVGLVWAVEDIRRVLDPRMKKDRQALVLLYSKPSWVPERDLFAWVAYSTETNCRNQVLKPLHDKRLIEYDGKHGRARISPLGGEQVEREILKTRTP